MSGPESTPNFERRPEGYQTTMEFAQFMSRASRSIGGLQQINPAEQMRVNRPIHTIKADSIERNVPTLGSCIKRAVTQLVHEGTIEEHIAKIKFKGKNDVAPCYGYHPLVLERAAKIKIEAVRDASLKHKNAAKHISEHKAHIWLQSIRYDLGMATEEY